MSAIPTKQVEFWLLGWSETNNGGCKVTFQIDEDTLDYFRAATVRKGKHAGQRYAGFLVEVGDDEKPVQESVRPLTPEEKSRVDMSKAHEGTIVIHPNPKKGGAHFPSGLCGLAVKWCEDDHFQAWLENTHPAYWNYNEAEKPDERATLAVRAICGIVSRKELDTNKAAEGVFREKIMEPYVKVRQEDGVDE